MPKRLHHSGWLQQVSPSLHCFCEKATSKVPRKPEPSQRDAHRARGSHEGSDEAKGTPPGQKQAFGSHSLKFQESRVRTRGNLTGYFGLVSPARGNGRSGLGG